MAAFGRLSAIVLLVFILGFATTAWAGTAQYSGSLVIQGVGNDTTNGASYPFNTNVFLGPCWLHLPSTSTASPLLPTRPSDNHGGARRGSVWRRSSQSH